MKNGPFVGMDLEIGPVVGIDPVVKFGLFRKSGQVESLTYILSQSLSYSNDFLRSYFLSYGDHPISSYNGLIKQKIFLHYVVFQ